MKKITKIVLLALTLALLLAVPFAVSASENEPALKIEAANLSFEDSVYPVFAVSGDNVDMQSVKLLVWTSPKTSADEYVKGTENAELTSYADETIDGVACKKFKYTKIYAKNMTDDIYVRAYAELDGEPVYSGITKYSVLRYAYNKLGYTGTATTDANLKEMLEGMLLYGAGAQKYFDYKTDRLATSRFYKITVEGGTLTDGTDTGFYLENDSVTLTAPATDSAGTPFAYWSDKSGSSVSTTASFALTVKAENNTYTAVYGEGTRYSEGLEFESSGDGSCILVGIGDCTDSDIVIPPTALDGDTVSEIDANAFEGEPITSVSIPSTVTYIGRRAFNGCTSLTDVYYDGTEAEWSANVELGSGNSALTGATMHFKTEPTPPAPEYTEPTIVISRATAQAGDTGIEITVALKKNPGIASLNLIVTYAEGLTLTSIEYNSAIGGMSQQPQTYGSPVVLNWFNGTADSEGDWVFATLSFDVSASAVAGDCDISLTYDPNNVYDITETNVSFDVVNGKITIE